MEVDEPVNEPLGKQEDVDLDAGGSDHMHVDPFIDAGNRILNFASMELCLLRVELDVLTPSHVLAGEAGPSNSQRSTGAPDDVVDVSDEASSGHNSSDDDDLQENVVTFPPRKRHRQSEVHSSSAESASPPTTHMQYQAQLHQFQKEMEEQGRRYAALQEKQ